MTDNKKLTKSLRTAIDNNNLDIVTELIGNNADIQSWERYPLWYPLLGAIKNNNLTMFKYLINNGALLGDRVLADAAKNGCTLIFKFLLKNYSFSTLQLHEALRDTVFANHVSIIAIFLKIAHSPDCYKVVFQMAYTLGNYHIIQYILLEYNLYPFAIQNIVNTKCIDECLYFDLERVDRNITKIDNLIKYFTQYYVVNRHDVPKNNYKHYIQQNITDTRCNDLCVAINDDNFDLTKQLIKQGANLAYWDMDLTWNPLLGAIKNKNLEMFKYLIAQGAKISTNVLIAAAKENCYVIVLFLLLRNSFFQDELEQALEEAAKYGHIFIVAILLDRMNMPHGAELAFTIAYLYGQDSVLLYILYAFNFDSNKLTNIINTNLMNRCELNRDIIDNIINDYFAYYNSLLYNLEL